MDAKPFTYQRQPDNVGAWRMGEACRRAAEAPAGDYIDRGLVLLRELQDKGYGIVELGALSAPAEATQAGAVPQPIIDALRFYAHGHHYNIDADHQSFDTVSGEPPNWLHSEREDDCTMIEDGSIAKAALCGGILGFEEPTEPVEGEVLVAAPQAPVAGRVEAMPPEDAHGFVQRHANAARALEHMHTDKNVERLKAISAELVGLLVAGHAPVADAARAEPIYQLLTATGTWQDVAKNARFDEWPADRRRIVFTCPSPVANSEVAVDARPVQTPATQPVFNDWQKHWGGCNGWKFSAVKLANGKRYPIFEVNNCYLTKEEATLLVEQLNGVSHCAPTQQPARASEAGEAAHLRDGTRIDRSVVRRLAVQFGLLPVEEEAQQAVTLTDEQREAIEWAAGRAHVEALGKPIAGIEGRRWRVLSDLFRAAAVAANAFASNDDSPQWTAEQQARIQAAGAEPMEINRLETTSEHIVRDMREGRFPKRSKPQMVGTGLPRSYRDSGPLETGDA